MSSSIYCRFKAPAVGLLQPSEGQSNLIAPCSIPSKHNSGMLLYIHTNPFQQHEEVASQTLKILPGICQLHP